MKQFVLIFLWVLPLNLFAETLFVGDSLRIGIRPKPTKSIPPIGVIRTGDAVESLRRQHSFTKIRTKSGIEGWVKSAYLTQKTVANHQLKIANDKIRSLQERMHAMEQEANNNQSNETQKTLRNTIQQLQVDKSDLRKEINHLKRDPIITTSTMNKFEITQFDLNNLNKEYLYAALGGIIGILILGFMFGVSWYKQQVTKRLGGLSI